ncbi:MAG: tetratricopeptide repeat protein [Actinomycetota bacterium]
MTTQRSGTPATSGVSLRGAVDLAAVAARTKAQEEAAKRPPSAVPWVVDVTDTDFQQVVVEQSLTVPVVVDLWATWCQPCTQLSPVLERLAQEYAGRFLLAKVDVDANQGLAQLFQAQSIPMVVAVVKGQPIPLFQGALPEQQVRAYLDELLRVSDANGVTGQMSASDSDADPQPTTVESGAVEPPLPPLHAEAFEAIERGDLGAAAAAYRTALDQSPADRDARIGLAQVELLRRTQGVDPQSAREAAAQQPEDPSAQMLAADVDLLGGHVEDAFSRLIDAIRRAGGTDRETLRTHLVQLFEVTGIDDDRVVAARRALANALF